MSKLNLDVKIQEDETTIERLILQDLVEQLNPAFFKIIPKLKKITADLLREYITIQPEYNAIINSDLRYELGIINPSARLLNIIDTLISNIETDFQAFTVKGNNISGGLTIMAVKSDYSDVINLPDSIVVTEKGVPLQWLRWLLVEGTQVIIANWSVEFGPFGRTGGAHMIEDGGNWSVPSEYAGQPQDNFITRAIRQMETPLKERFEQCIQSI